MPEYNITVKIDTDKSRQGIQNVEKDLGGVEKTANKVASAVTAALAFVGIGVGIQELIRLADTFATIQNALRRVTADEEQLVEVTGRLADISNATFQSFEATAATYARVSAATRELGLTQEETLQFTESLNQAVALGGTTAESSAAGLFQLSQGLQSGALRGDELVSVLENLPEVARVIGNSLGLNAAQLREFAAEGGLTAEIVIGAFQEAREEIGNKFANAIVTPSQAMQVLRNNTLLLVGGFAQASGATSAYAQTILFLADNLETIARVVGAAAIAIGTTFAVKAIGAAITGLRALSLALLTNPFTALVIAIGAAVSLLISFSDQISVTADGTVSAFDVIASYFEDFKNIVSSAFNAVLDIVSGFSGQVEEALSVEEIARGVIIGIEFIINVFQDFSRFFTGVLTTVLNNVRTFTSQFDGLFGDISITVDDVVQFVFTALDFLAAAFVGVTRGIEAALSDLPNVLNDVFIQGINGVIDILEDGTNLIVNFFVDLPGVLFDIGVDIIKALGDGIVAAFDAVVDFAKRIPELLKAAITGGLDAFDLAAEFTKSLTESVTGAFEKTEDEVIIQFGRLENTSSGAAAKVGVAIQDGFETTLQEKPISNYITTTYENATADAANRLEGIVNKQIEPVFEDPKAPVFENAAKSMKEAADEAAKLEKAVESAADGVSNFAGISEEQLTQLVTNIDGLFQSLGVNIAEIFEALPQSVQDFAASISGDLINALGIVGIAFDELGIGIEEVFGEKAATAVSFFSRLSTEQLDLIIDSAGAVVDFIAGPFTDAFTNAGGGGIVEGLGGAFDSVVTTISDFFNPAVAEATDTVSVAGQVGTVSAGAITAGFGEAGTAAGEAGTAVAGTTGEISTLQSIGTKALGAITAGMTAFGVATSVGANKTGQLGAAIGGVLGSLAGSFLGPAGAAIGGIVGGAAGGIFGNLFGSDPEEFDESKAGRKIFNGLVEGAALARADLIKELSKTEFDVAETLQRIEKQFKKSSTTIQADLREAFKAEGLVVNIESAATSAAGTLSNAFGVSAIDIANILNTLPPEIAGSFEAIGTNAEQIAQQIAQDFGLNADEVQAILENLAATGVDVLKSGIEDPVQSIAANLAESFGASADAVKASLATLPPEATANFNAIQENAELIARNLSPIIGVSVDEIVALLKTLGQEGAKEFAVVGQLGSVTFNELVQDVGIAVSIISQEFGGLTVDVADNLRGLGEEGANVFGVLAVEALGNLEEIVIGFGGTRDQGVAILQELQTQGFESFADLGENALQILTDIVVGFGGTGEDAAAILEILEANAGASFEEILNSSLAASEGALGALGAVGEAGSIIFNELAVAALGSLEEIVIGFGGTEDQATAILEELAAQGINSFADLGDNALQVLTEIVIGFGGTQADAAAILEVLEANAGASFADILNSGQTSAEQIANQFGIAGNIIGDATEGAANRAKGAFGGIAAAAVEAANAAIAQFGRLSAEGAAAQKKINSINAQAKAGGGGTLGGLESGGMIHDPMIYIAPKGSVETYGGGPNMADGGVFNAQALLVNAGLGKSSRGFDVGLIGENGPEEVLRNGSRRRGAGGGTTNVFQITVRGASQRELNSLAQAVRDLAGVQVINSVDVATDVLEASFD